MEDITNVITVLNDLIKINSDRITEYEKTAARLDNSELMLKALLYQISDDSQELNDQLASKVIALGGEPATDSTLPGGRVYTLWLDIKTTFLQNYATTLSMVEKCEVLENATQVAYREVLVETTDFPKEITDMIRKQQYLLSLLQDLIKNQHQQYNEVTK